MSKEGKFLIYCTEQYKSAKNLSGLEISILFSRFQVWDYLYACFEALHTTGINYIIQDIDAVIASRKTP